MQQTLAAWTIKDQLRGLTTLDAMQESRQKQAPRFICIPNASCIPCSDSGAEDNSEIAGCSKVVAVLPGERLYDLGAWANLRDVFERPYRDPTQASVFTAAQLFNSNNNADRLTYRWPKLNPIVLDRILTQNEDSSIRKQFDSRYRQLIQGVHSKDK